MARIKQVFTIVSVETGGLLSETETLASAIDLATILKMYFGSLVVRQEGQVLWASHAP